MFSYESVEEAIFQRLLAFEDADIEVVKLPESEADFKRPFEKSKITVGYKGSKWGNGEKEGGYSRAIGHAIQTENVTFEIALQSRTLRGPRGLYNIKRVVTLALLGYTPPDCSTSLKLEMSGMTGAATHTDGVWTYSVLVCTSTESVEDFEEDLSVILKKITNKVETTGDEFIVE